MVCPGGGIGQARSRRATRPSSSRRPASAATTHLVKPGETLSSIAFNYGTPWYVIARVNNLANPNLIYAGQTLCIP